MIIIYIILYIISLGANLLVSRGTIKLFKLVIKSYTFIFLIKKPNKYSKIEYYERHFLS